MRWITVPLAHITVWRARRNPRVKEFLDALATVMEKIIPGEHFTLELRPTPEHPLNFGIECVTTSPRAQVAWSELQDVLQLGGLGSSSGPNLNS
jgi:hypothetical protein